jgi:hypothetical protein
MEYLSKDETPIIHYQNGISNNFKTYFQVAKMFVPFLNYEFN